MSFGASITVQNTDQIETNNLMTPGYPQLQVSTILVRNLRVEAARLHDRVASKQDCAAYPVGSGKLGQVQGVGCISSVAVCAKPNANLASG